MLGTCIDATAGAREPNIAERLWGSDRQSIRCSHRLSLRQLPPHPADGMRLFIKYKVVQARQLRVAEHEIKVPQSRA